MRCSEIHGLRGMRKITAQQEYLIRPLPTAQSLSLSTWLYSLEGECGLTRPKCKTTQNIFQDFNIAPILIIIMNIL